jgi:hypothetical protein
VRQTVAKKFKEKEVKYISGRNNYLFVWKNINDLRMVISFLFFIPLFLIRDLLKLRFRFWKCFLGALPRIPLISKSKFLDLKPANIYTDKEVLSWVNKRE